MNSSFLVPILPIPNIVFFPNTVLPVYIVEAPYIKMVQRCVENIEMVGISLAEPLDNLGFGKVNKYTPKLICSVGTPVIIEPLDRGTLKVLFKGVQRVQLTRIHQNLPYLIFEGCHLPDKEESAYMGDNLVMRLRTILDGWLLENISNSLERESFQKNLGSVSHIVDYICMFLIQDLSMKQLLLENQSLIERIKILNILLREPNPYMEDIFAVDAFVSYDNLEKKVNISH